MLETKNTKKYDLEERTFIFAQKCKAFVQGLPKTISNIEYSKQLVRSSGSQAANYIEANESLSKKDFVNRAKICRKEAKESRLWIKLIDPDQQELLQEATELTKIFNSIVQKST
ncbi:MAG: four helix bundle protein [Patescibacteria group bacterium]